jgi:hypothetical protein
MANPHFFIERERHQAALRLARKTSSGFAPLEELQLLQAGTRFDFVCAPPIASGIT